MCNIFDTRSYRFGYFLVHDSLNLNRNLNGFFKDSFDIRSFRFNYSLVHDRLARFNHLDFFQDYLVHDHLDLVRDRLESNGFCSRLYTKLFCIWYIVLNNQITVWKKKVLRERREKDNEKEKKKTWRGNKMIRSNKLKFKNMVICNFGLWDLKLASIWKWIL